VLKLCLACLAWILSVTCLILIALFGLLFQFIKLFVLPVISGFIPFDVPGDIFENDTVYVDGFKGATIHWSKFYTVHKTPSAQSIQIIFVVYGPPILFLVGLALVIIYQPPLERVGIGLLVGSIVFQLQAPYLIRRIYKDKSRCLDPYFFGIEGYVSIEEIEEKMFGRKLDILSWHPWGSPLSCHEKGGEHTEWACPLRDDSGPNDSLAAEEGLIHTWDIKPKDPGVDDNSGIKPKIKPGIERKISSNMGEMKIFTLVDTYSKTVTLFEAKRPPTVLLIGGSEGGMKRALACSYDAINGTLYRETVLRLRSDVAAQMPDVPRIRLGLRRPFNVHHQKEALGDGNCTCEQTQRIQ